MGRTLQLTIHCDASLSFVEVFVMLPLFDMHVLRVYVYVCLQGTCTYV